jgi:hypothetical protein
MRRFYSATLIIIAATAISFSQQASQPQPTPPPLSNHHMLLVPAGTPGSGEVFWIAVAPDGQLSILPVSQLQAKMGEGYRPFTFGEFQNALTALMNQNTALNAEVSRLETNHAATETTATEKTNANSQTSAVSEAALLAAAARADAQRREQQRQQAILTFLMGRQTQKVNMNVNVTDCTKFPALCVNH